MSNNPNAKTATWDILQKLETGQSKDIDQLVPILYDELRRLAHKQLAREQRNHTLQTTALVHEVYLKLTESTQVTKRGEAYFFAAASRAMRQVLVDYARRRNASKRGSGEVMLSLEEGEVAVDAFASELLDLDEALESPLLRSMNARLACSRVPFFWWAHCGRNSHAPSTYPHGRLNRTGPWPELGSLEGYSNG